MKEFSELTLQKLNADGEYYVYGLIDPRSEKLFYIGKGTGNRVFQHVIESDKNPESEKAKLLTIKDIELSGNSVRHILINWGLSESEAFASEATLINLINYISPDALTSVTYKLKLNGGDIKAVQGDSGHSQINMVTDVYSHIIDDDRRRNAEMFEDAFYGKQDLDPQLRKGESGENIMTVPEGVDAELLAKVLSNPEMAALLTSLAKTMK